jgi:beta-glucosidase
MTTSASQLESWKNQSHCCFSSSLLATMSVSYSPSRRTVRESTPISSDRRGSVSELGLDLQEKVSLLSGSGIWTIPGVTARNLSLASITVSDGPHGVRKPLSDLTLQVAHPATCFPAGCAVAASWNREMVHRLGQGLARECQLYHVSVLLGPAMNLKRHPAGGRNLEYFSEDPYLTGMLAAAYVQGVQSTGKVGACLKHFAVNNQESHRFVVDAVVDERTLRELYLKSFEIAIRNSHPPPCMVMGAYNRLNGVYCCENEWLLQEVLRKEWKYQGVCVTDWGATNDRVRAIRAGMDLEMPGNKGVFHRDIYKECQQDPSFETTFIDASASRVLNLIGTYPPPTTSSSSSAEEELSKQEVFDANHQLAYEVALESAVLLKNENDLLPLIAQNIKKLAVIGEFAKYSRYQGMGSSHCTPTRVSHALDALTRYFPDTDPAMIEYAAGYQALANKDDIQPELIEEAKAVAVRGDVVLMFLGLPEILESEGFDRETLRLPKQHVALLEAITAIHDKIIVVLSNGGVVELPDCITRVSSILEGYLLGQAGGPAVADLIFGKVSPSGRLPETMPIAVEHLPSNPFFPGSRDRVEYREGINVGYRYFDSVPSSASMVLFPFGHGLTYTKFEYSELQVTVEADETKIKQVQIQFRLRNSGNVAAKEVPQCYVAPLEASVYRPSHELKAFTKVFLNPGETKDVSFVLARDSFCYFDIGHRQRVVEPGNYEIQIGASSQDICLRQTIEFFTGMSPSKLARESYSWETAMSTTDEAFASRFGPNKNKILDAILQAGELQPAIPLDRNSLLKEVARHSILGKILFQLIFKIGCREIQPGPMETAEFRMVRANVENLPLRTLVLFGKGMLSMQFLDGLIAIMNGNIEKAIRKFGETIWHCMKGCFGRWR